MKPFAKLPHDRRQYIGGSDARIIMGNEEADLVRLWREKRGELDAQDLSNNLVVQLGNVTEELNRRWYERSSGYTIIDIQNHLRHPVHKWMGATLDGRVHETEAVFESKFMLPWSFSEEAAADKHMAQLQHNMWVANAREGVLSIITGGGKWLEIKVFADPIYQHMLFTAEKKFWRYVQDGTRPSLLGVEPPRPRSETVNVADMTRSNLWAEFAAVYLRTRDAHHAHETARAELKKLVPEEAREAFGHGLRAKRSKTGAISFDRIAEDADASIQ
ncbi:YqaJ viral recombinase family protein [uncultured Bradyrhizobium sp.]|jgi:predicted phage-related endonuclease|uniref:YqaJ viral recombinase family protein n=1 Tax=uncultured Bradyrhizobium sp. TaxID=199684 RepID=UPI002606AC05|nr:YqaJ viral recombinase family protein [uncultured Bradyrhizobium sp.]